VAEHSSQKASSSSRPAGQKIRFKNNLLSTRTSRVQQHEHWRHLH
jgi:hypothetical protein